MKRKSKPTRKLTRPGAAVGSRPRARVELPAVVEEKKQRPIMAELYRRAEAQLRQEQQNLKARTAGPKSAADPQRQFHELQVHQVELELQNIELQEARDRMEGLLEKYTDLYDFAPVGYLSLDEAGVVLESNLTGAVLLGVERARLINRPLPPLVAPPSRPDFFAFLQRVFAGTGRQVGEVRLIREDGTSFWGELNGTASLAPGEPRKWCRVAISDITVLKQVEEVQGRMAAIVQSSDDAIISMDLNGDITSWNPGAESIFGFTAAEMEGSSMLRLTPADGRAEAKQMLGKIKASKRMQHFETLRRTKDGRLIDVSITASPIRNAAGRVIGVSKVARDITGRKRAQEILRRNEALFSALIEQAPVGVYVVDDQLRLQQVNPRARPLFRKVLPLMGRNLTEIEHILWPKRVADQVVKRFRQTLKTGRPYQSPEFAERRRDTGVREVYEWQLQRVTLPDGEQGVVCFFNDITKRKHAEEVQRRLAGLTASNRKLEEAIVRRRAVEESLRKSERHQRDLLVQSHRMQEQLRQLSRQVLRAQEEERKRISRELHDVIAQTLTGINVRLATLKQAAATNPKELERNLARTQRLVRASVAIVHEFARELRPAVLDDLGLIPALHSFLKSFSMRTGIRTRLTAFAGVEQLDAARRTVLYRVAQEALTNVSRHAEASQTRVDIEQRGGVICMSIKDNGKGFPLKHLSPRRKRQRLGLLGMSERVEMVKGRLTIESAPGKGTTIQAQIPLASDARGGGAQIPDESNR